jgi:demethylmenaquinone methyltransferase/2-methoxy-6-polyprenyl-1,4-benzoquinol methylase
MVRQGDNTAAASQREQPLKRMFDTVHGRYDLLNRLLTLRFDERWRRRAARLCLEGEPSRVLDLCCGTGDLAVQLARQSDLGAEVVGLDFSPTMLLEAQKKGAQLNGDRTVHFVKGDASAMQFQGDAFDVVGIAFAFRNLTWRNRLQEEVLAEVLRVLRPGGRFVIVETSQPGNPVLRVAFHGYMGAMVARVGGVVSRQKAAYRYLAKSAQNFYDSDGVCTLLESAGFEGIEVQKLLGGIAAIHVAVKPARTVR